MSSARGRSWLVRHPLLTVVVILAGVVWVASAVGITGAADPDERGRHSSSAGQQRQDGRVGDRPGPAPTYVVTHVVDGDTVDLGNGETVRLVGIDAPEIGECGHDEATAALVALVEGRTITLGESDEDRDKYGRLLRYVDIGEVDAGLQIVKRGLAVARYDSRDGYGFHPREPRYIAADRQSRDICR